MPEPYEIRRDAIERHEKATWEQGKSHGQEIRCAAILTLIENQIAEWEAERKDAEAKYRQDPEYTTWRSVAERATFYYSAANLLLEQIKEKFGAH